ncbi:Transcription factor ILI1, partial [Dichanthelium oligosanthes]
MSSSRRSRTRRAGSSSLSSSSSRSISEDQISELLSKLQALLPESQTRNGAHRQGSAARVLQDTCSYIRSLHQEVDNLSETLAELLSSADVTSDQAAIIRSLLIIMSETGHTVQVTNLSSRVSESDLHEFFSFSGPIEHIELIRSGEYGATAYVTFKERYALETAALLSGATIVDQPVCITYWGQPEETFNFWDRPTWDVEEEIEYRNYQACQFNATPQEALTVAQDVVKTMLAKGYVLSKDALAKARAFDESRGLTAAAAAKAAELSKRIGLTDRVNAGVGAINAGVGAMRSVDESYGISETTKTVATATGRTAAK